MCCCPAVLVISSAMVSAVCLNANPVLSVYVRLKLDSKIKSMNFGESFISMQCNEQPTTYERGGLVYSGRAYIDAEVHVSFHGNEGLIFYEFKLADPSGINLTEGGENTYKGGMGFTHTGFSKGGGRIIIKGIVYCMN